MWRLGMGYLIVAWSLLACGKSSTPSEVSAGGSSNPGSGAEPGGSTTDSEGGTPLTDGESGSASTGGESGSSVGGAAGGTSDRATYFEPGSRLKPMVLTSTGGIDVLEGDSSGGWYDSELDFDCYFAVDEAGVERCFPRAILPGPGLHADASCNSPVLAAGARSSCDPLEYQYIAGSRGCSLRGYKLGAELPASTPLFFSEDGVSCEPSTQSPDVGPFIELEEVPAETFVGMQRRARPRAPGLDAYVREGADGSWQTLGYFDPSRDAPCFDSLTTGGWATTCVPSFVSAVGNFAESSCQTHVADARYRSCKVEQPTTIIESAEDTSVCPALYDFRLYEIDDLRETKPHVVDDSGACVESPGASGEFYVRGAEIVPSSLPRLETHRVGTGALRALYTGFGGAPYMRWNKGLFLQDAAGNPCLPFRFPDGSLRCVPTAFPDRTADSLLYEDASCSGNPVLAWIRVQSCGKELPLPTAVTILERPTDCLSDLTVTEVLAVAGESEKGTLYAKDAATGACQVAPSISPPQTYLRMGQSLKTSTFPELERTIRD
jgi:hypothetical protein